MKERQDETNTTFTGPLAGVETVNIRMVEPELFLVYLAGDHADLLRHTEEYSPPSVTATIKADMISIISCL